MFYSKSTNGFYDKSIHKTIPPDAVEISKTVYEELLSGQSTGLKIVSDNDGYPTLEEDVLTDSEKVNLERVWRDNELIRADKELNKVQDSDPKASGSVSAWREYRKALRALPEHVDFPNKTARPVAPDGA